MTAVVLVLLAGCAAGSPLSKPLDVAAVDAEQEATPGAVAEPTEPPTTHEPTPEELYIAAGGDSPASARNDCENYQEHYGEDPMTAVASMIENAFHLDLLGIEHFCPEFLEAAEVAATGFYDGSHRVGEDVAPGTYRTMVNVGSVGTTDCYWERVGGGGDTLANDFVTLAPDGVTVTIQEGEGFMSDGCGAWLPVD